MNRDCNRLLTVGKKACRTAADKDVDAYQRMVDLSHMQLVENDRGFLKQQSWHDLTLEKQWLSGSDRVSVVMLM